MNDLLLYSILAICVFLVGMATGIVVMKFKVEHETDQLLKRLEILGSRNNEILDDLKNVISFNNELADKNRKLEEQITKFIKEWT